ncbi:glucan biosynthesis protein G [Thiorhodococcus mannitoliphagus]|uniref:Glucans biosynthesis protein G n=1 Tax=Thiorhodococcus mannitoliphagus TaxID=329406 RepID=A0A6P1E496_9GAMM|nr:glucan biosynthesis protein G [Thiorhodococcus mannitoliphagus]NEX22495.1 glucan biosynthesis protein G [Thiorhodococcus mannitoliphagus]
MKITRLLGILSFGVAIGPAFPVSAAENPGVVEPAPIEGAPGDFTFAAVVGRAEALANKDFEPDRPELPAYLADLDYDHYRDIRFDRDESLWREDGLPFQMQLFPRGFLFKDRVTINVIEDGVAQPLPFRHDLFDYGKNEVPDEMPSDLGFAGLRLLYPINQDAVFDEVAVFLGASYFRAVSKGANYGITARGLAIDTGLPTKEEFPVFREFWVRKPAQDAVDIRLYALLDSESASGAYSFLIRPGIETVIDVKAHIFMRQSVQKLGIAPLTSMFFHGENSDRFVDDFRPEVHDSDGLLVENGTGERIWRPLVNPLRLHVSDFAAENPKAFGLLQRDRDFRNYQDLEAHYHNRPSALIEPVGDWGKGVVELVEIPSNAERYDNIVAYWMPERQPEAGDTWRLEYRLRFGKDLESGLMGGRVKATRIGASGTDILDPSRRKFVMDFIGESLAQLDPETEIEAMVTSTTGELSKPIAQPNPETQGWRLFFELEPEGKEPADLRAFLRHGHDVLSETWSFRWVRE